MGRLEDNKRKIDSAFARLLAKKDTVNVYALVQAMQSAMSLCLDIHNEMALDIHPGHSESMGWCIVCDGQLVSSQVYRDGEEVSEGMEDIFSEAVSWSSGKGIHAFFISDMSLPFLREDYEVDILDATASDIADQFIDIYRWSVSRVKTR